MKYFNKQVFWKMVAVFFVLDLCVLMTGCGDWESQAISIIGLLGPAIQAALAILAAFGVGVSADVMSAFENWSQQAQAALLNLKGLIAQFQTAVAAAQPGILAEIQAVLNTLSTNLATVLTELHVTDPATQAKIEAVFAAISAMLAAVVNLVPVIQGKVTDHNEEARLYVAYQEKAKNFKKDFNAAAGVFGKEYEIG